MIPEVGYRRTYIGLRSDGEDWSRLLFKKAVWDYRSYQMQKCTVRGLFYGAVRCCSFYLSPLPPERHLPGYLDTLYHIYPG